MENTKRESNLLLKDVETVQQISGIPSLLDIIVQTTGMGFVAVARVTEEAWVACSVRDDIGFGLKPGGELAIETTICNEIRDDKQPVIINDVPADPLYCNHHTPAQYGFRSYISVPINRKDGSFFGTLCAIDPRPNTLNVPHVKDLFFHFADLIAFHLQAAEEIAYSQKQFHDEQALHQQSKDDHKAFSSMLENQVQERTAELKEKADHLEMVNKELQSFTYVASHDLQEPLRKIKFYADRLVVKEEPNLSPSGKADLERIGKAATRMQNLVSDLIAYPQTTAGNQPKEMVNLHQVVEEVLQDMAEEIERSGAQVNLGPLCECYGIPFQVKQLFQNLLSNALKFAQPGQPAQVTLSSSITTGAELAVNELSGDGIYCHIKVSDKGIGFPPEFSEKIFQLFQRLHSKDRYDGTGIGLAIVHKIVENHGGAIVAQGVPGEGATFNIYLPMSG
ncbi:GAF domain-containing protein [Flavisolibacter sp. BT320]|nr:GAF domain-containing protein [Flavisolibacter longurius]